MVWYGVGEGSFLGPRWCQVGAVLGLAHGSVFGLVYGVSHGLCVCVSVFCVQSRCAYLASSRWLGSGVEVYGHR